MKHTPTPWTISDDDGHLWITDAEANTAMARMMHLRPDAQANARHIVHCVNNMPKVVEALKDAADMLQIAGEWTAEQNARTLLAALKAEKGGEL